MFTFAEIAPERALLVVERPAGSDRSMRRIVLRDAYCEALDCPGCRTECELSYEGSPGRIHRVTIDPVSGKHDVAQGAPAEVVADAAEVAEGQGLWSLLERFQAVQAWKALQRDAPTATAGSRLYRLGDFLERALPSYLFFKHGADTWVAHDLYCVDPQCPCFEGLLQLNRVQTGPMGVPLHHSLWLDLATDEARGAEDDRALDEAEMRALAALRRAHGPLRSVLELRRRLVRDLAAKRLTFARDHASRDAPTVSPTRDGRNDPCPCGSGKKRKKCCG